MVQHGGLNGWVGVCAVFLEGRGFLQPPSIPRNRDPGVARAGISFLLCQFPCLVGAFGVAAGQLGMDLYARLVSSSDSAVPPGLPSFRVLCYKM